MTNRDAAEIVKKWLANGGLGAEAHNTQFRLAAMTLFMAHEREETRAVANDREAK